MDYTLALLFFALGLMSKAMLVTLPFVMLLLDCWPLKRFTIHVSPFTSTPDRLVCWKSFRSSGWRRQRAS